MRGVVIGAQNAVEKPAGAVAHVVQETRRGGVFVPVAEHADPATVGEHEPRDVERFGGRVPAARGVWPAVDVAARVTAEVLDALYGQREMPLGGGRDG